MSLPRPPSRMFNFSFPTSVSSPVRRRSPPRRARCCRPLRPCRRLHRHPRTATLPERLTKVGRVGSVAADEEVVPAVLGAVGAGIAGDGAGRLGASCRGLRPGAEQTVVLVVPASPKTWSLPALALTVSSPAPKRSVHLSPSRSSSWPSPPSSVIGTSTWDVEQVVLISKVDVQRRDGSGRQNA